MTLENYRDLSSGGGAMSTGFQFEFFCTACTRTWKTPFQPYRVGQVTGLLSRLVSMVSSSTEVRQAANGIAGMNPRGAHEKALARSIKQAESLYTVCPSCRKEVCADCYDTEKHKCLNCVESALRAMQRDKDAGSGAQTAGGAACPNCSTSSMGGRFCAECGFDMASTHKSCPACSTMVPRQARFCTDCGHSF